MGDRSAARTTWLGLGTVPGPSLVLSALTPVGEPPAAAPTEDFIQLPPRTAFLRTADYYSTALHELGHWTGHPRRCDRPLGRRHGIDAYAFEELVAEMCSAFLCSHVRLPGQLQHDSYIASWLTALRNDKRLIFTVASQAQKAVDYLLPKPREVEAALQAMAVPLSA